MKPLRHIKFDQNPGVLLYIHIHPFRLLAKLRIYGKIALLYSHDGREPDRLRRRIDLLAYYGAIRKRARRTDP